MLLDTKLKRLKSIIQGRGSAVIAFSGGVDSSLVCAVSHEVLGEKALAVTAVSQTYPPGELEIAREIAKGIGIKHIVITTYELNDPNFTSNPRERCYYCKRELLRQLDEIRRKLAFKHIFDGTNAEDYLDFRPGLRAIKEFGVVSPLAEARLMKVEVRKIASKYGLPNSGKPANPCLASRIPFGQRITPEKLERIARGEEFIHSLGFVVVRVRDHENMARVEVGKKELDRAKKLENKIALALKELGYDSAMIDPRGYQIGGANI